MARHFDIPAFYKSPVITRVKRARQAQDRRGRDLSPTLLDFGPVRFLLARHFGFCFGVENAIEIAYRTVDSYPDRGIFLLSEMIHNPNVNDDLRDRGVRFIFTPTGEQLVPWDELTSGNIVIVPAFGTTLEVQQELDSRGIDPFTYNTTCPFVEKVWNRSAQLGQSGYTVVIHGKATHEETRATFSHSVKEAPTVVVFDLEEAGILRDIITGTRDLEDFHRHFGHKSSDGFDPGGHLDRVGVVNQTTMLASETHEIARILKDALMARFGESDQIHHFADTSDTLCYATNENQNATYALIDEGADLALVVGGYNSSNTAHIVELCAASAPTYFIQNADEIIDADLIRHFDLASRTIQTDEGWLANGRPLTIALTCGASCPDAIVDSVLLRVLSFFPDTRSVDEVLAPFPPLSD